MSAYLTPLLQLQRFYLPCILGLLLWAVWRTIRRKDLAVGLALYLGLVIVVDGYLNTGIYLPGLEKGSIRYSELCALFLLVNGSRAVPEHAPNHTVAYLVAVYFVLLLVSALRSDSMLAGVFEFRRLIIPQIVGFLVARRGLGSNEELRRFFFFVTAVVMIVAVFVFWDVFFDRWLLKSDMLSKPEYWMNRKHGRFGGMFLNPNFLGAFVVLVFPPVFVWTLNEPQRWRRVFGGIGLLALVFCLVETQSRGPLLAFSVAVVLLVLGPCGGLSRTRRLGMLALFLAVFAIFMPGFFEHAIERFDAVGRETTTEEKSRQTVWIYTQRIILDHPIAGIGFGEQQFVRAMDAYGFGEQYGEGSLDNPHNSYLQAAVYAGIPALAAFVLGNVILLGRAVRVAIREESGADANMAFGIAVGITGFLACIYPDMHLFTQNVAPIYWVFFGLLLSLAAGRPEASKT